MRSPDIEGRMERKLQEVDEKTPKRGSRKLERGIQEAEGGDEKGKKKTRRDVEEKVMRKELRNLEAK